VSRMHQPVDDSVPHPLARLAAETGFDSWGVLGMVAASWEKMDEAQRQDACAMLVSFVRDFTD